MYHVVSSCIVYFMNLQENINIFDLLKVFFIYSQYFLINNYGSINYNSFLPYLIHAKILLQQIKYILASIKHCYSVTHLNYYRL